MSYFATEIIAKKRNKASLSKKELQWMIEAYLNDEVADYQMSALLMAIVLNGMNRNERFDLTEIMLHSGETLDLSHIDKPKIDKHSTGGVGDKTSMILAPIVAACDIAVPMMAGRGLGHTGGTLDKLESIPGFVTRIDLSKYLKQLEDIGVAIMGQTERIAPADKRLYALRDVTSTVDSVDLISASIMSKKLAEGIDGLVLDVKTGSGAFMREQSQALQLAKSLKEIGEDHGLKVHALISDMNQPLGRKIGNALEIEECVEILKNEETLATDCRELSLVLAAHMIFIAGKAESLKSAQDLAKNALISGKAYEIFEQIVKSQGGNLNLLPQAKHKIEVKSSTDGNLISIDTKQIGMAGILLRAGRRKVDDEIDPAAGIEICKKIGDKVSIGDTLFYIFSNSLQDLDECQKILQESLVIGDDMHKQTSLVYEVLD